jgi:CheY-like chemotaxis protein
VTQRVLIVEDDPMNAKFMASVLKRKCGIEVFISENVEEILKIASECNLSAIIMDICLPNSEHNGQKVDGVYITKLLKAEPKTATIPVVLATAQSMPGAREHLLELTKAEHYIPKPFHDPDDFMREVISVIRPDT